MNPLNLSEEEFRIYINNMVCPSCGRLIQAISEGAVGGLLELSIGHFQGIEWAGAVMGVRGSDVMLSERPGSTSSICSIHVRHRVPGITAQIVAERSACNTLMVLDGAITMGEVASWVGTRGRGADKASDRFFTPHRELTCFRYSPPSGGGECLRCGQARQNHVPSATVQIVN